MINRLGSNGIKWVWTKWQKKWTTDGAWIIYGRRSGIHNQPGYRSGCRAIHWRFFKNSTTTGTNKEEVVFQQYNDWMHTLRLATMWLTDQKVLVLRELLTKSPDSNLIEHQWGDLLNRVHSYEKVPKSTNELLKPVQGRRNRIPLETCLNFIERMPRRVIALMQAKGGYTHYWKEAIKSHVSKSRVKEWKWRRPFMNIYFSKVIRIHAR
jgi:hypothetical protein